MELKVYFNSEKEAKDTIVVCANESEHNPQHCVSKTLTEACQKNVQFSELHTSSLRAGPQAPTNTTFGR